MGTPFVAEVKITAFNFPPKGWAFCNGQLLGIAQNQALFSLLGTTYGGNGQTTFGLPNLQSRTPMHWGNGGGLPPVVIGQNAGEAAHTLTIAEMAGHTHTASGSSAAAAVTTPGGSMLATPTASTYNQTSPNTALVTGTVGKAGSSQPHNNMQPYLVLNFVIALTGIYPSRN